MSSRPLTEGAAHKVRQTLPSRELPPPVPDEGPGGGSARWSAATRTRPETGEGRYGGKYTAGNKAFRRLATVENLCRIHRFPLGHPECGLSILGNTLSCEMQISPRT